MCRGDVIIYVCCFWMLVERGCNIGLFFLVILYMCCDGNLRGLYKKKIEMIDMEWNGFKKIKFFLKWVMFSFNIVVEELL